MKSIMFRAIKDGQKMNHFPGTFQIGRKDRLWRNLQKLVAKHGLTEFGIMPKTYVLPHDLKLLKHDWEKYAANNEKWIIKPVIWAYFSLNYDFSYSNTVTCRQLCYKHNPKSDYIISQSVVLFDPYSYKFMYRNQISKRWKFFTKLFKNIFDGWPESISGCFNVLNNNNVLLGIVITSSWVYSECIKEVNILLNNKYKQHFIVSYVFWNLLSYK